MSSAYDTLARKVDELTATNQAIKPIAEALKTQGLQLTLDQLLQYDIKNVDILSAFRYLLLFLKYLEESPKGEHYTTLNQHYIYALKLVPPDVQTVVNPFMSLLYFGGLSKELNKVEDITQLVPWLTVYGYLKQENADVMGFESALGISLSKHIWEMIGAPEKDLARCVNCVYVMCHAQACQFDLGDTVYLLVSSVYGYLNLKYEMYKGGANRDIPEVRMLIGWLKHLVLKNDLEKGQLKQLEEFFGFDQPAANQGGQEAKQKKVRKEKEFERDPSLPYAAIDFQSMVFKQTVYVNVQNPKVSVNIHHYTCPVKGEVALKIYDIKDATYNSSRIKTEIDILETLSQHSQPNNAFLKFHGSYWTANQVYLAMEYHPNTLMTVITSMKESKQSFNEAYLILYTSQLIDAFAYMESIGVYHQDIKPHNILVTANWILKIIDFSVSEMKSYDDATLAATGMRFIQGTQGYMAPELQESANSENRGQVKYRRNKADVFSLGLTILQLYNLEELLTLNYKENHHKLMAKVGEIRYHWLQTMLEKMLKLDFHDRPSFKACKKFIPTGDAKTTQT